MVTEGGFKHHGATSTPSSTLKTQLCLPRRTPAGKGNCWDLSKSEMSLSSTLMAFEVLLQGYRYLLKGLPDFAKGKRIGHWFSPCKGVGPDLDCSGGWISVLLTKPADLPRTWWLCVVWGVVGPGDP